MKALLVRIVPLLKGIIAWAVILGFFPATLSPVWAESPAKNILFLFAFEHNVPSYHMVEAGVKQVLEGDSTIRLVFFYEHMDLARFPQEAYRKSLLSQYRLKYAGKHIDLIIALNSPAVDFLIQHGEQIFPGTPVIFSLMTKGQVENRKLRPNFTGVADTPDFTGTLDLALRLLPQTQQVFVVSGSDDADKGFVNQVRKAYKPYQRRLKFKYLSGLPMDDLLRKVASLPKHSIIIYSSIYKDGAGRAFVPIIALRLLSPVANAPIFGAWNPFLGNGVVGGSVADLEQDGRDVGKLALDILRGSPDQTTPGFRHGKNTIIIDWRQLKRWGLDADRLPTGSVVKYRETTFWNLYRWETAGVVSFVLLESLLIGVLLAQRNRRLRAEDGLRLANEKLEFRIHERTAELQKANQLLQVEMDERRRTEDELKGSEEKLRGIFDTMHSGIILVDSTGKIIFANRRMAEMFGYTLDQLIGSTYVEHTYATESEEATQKMRQLIQGVIDHVFLERLYQRQDGTTFWGMLSGRRLFHPDGSFWALVGVIHDITEQKMGREQQKILEKQLQQAQKMEAIGTLAGGIAHDFNNILGAILGYAELNLDDAENGRVNPHYIRQIIAATDRAKGLVKQILTFSRRVDPERKILDLNQEVVRAMELLERTLPKMISTQLLLSPDLRCVNADPNQLSQMILNLASNAYQAMPDGGKLTISTENISLADKSCLKCGEPLHGDWVMLTISDTGHGINPNDISKIFDPFFTTKDVGKGTGLGLSTVHGIVLGHGGHIECHSQLDQGTDFKIYLPGAQSTLEEINNQSHAESDTLLGATETILLVDDEDSLRQLGTNTLKSRGYEVLTARSGEEALEIYRERGHQLDLVIMDLGMPGMGGHKALKAILEVSPDAYVLVASGYSADDQVKAALESGAVGYVAKPYKREELLATIRSLFHGKANGC